MTEQAEHSYDLFISYAEADRTWVEGNLLHALGLPRKRVITPQDFRLGAALVAEFERAIVSSRYTLLVLSPAYLADQWSLFGEQLGSHASVAAGRDRLIPLLLRPCTLPLRVDFRVRLDCTDQANWESEAARLRNLLGQPEPAPEHIPCPYPGMKPFSEADAERFYGREQFVQKIIEHLRLHPFLAIIGPSGSGKSSLLYAGLIPQLKRTSLFQAGDWSVLSLRPGPQPLQRLAAALGEHLPESDTAIAETLAQDSTALSRYLATIVAAGQALTHCLLLIDQFEEVFVQCKDADQRRRLLEQVRQVIEHPPERCLLVLAIRADFFGDCQESLLWPYIEASHLNLPPLSPADLRRAMVEPAQAVGVSLEPALVERLISDAADEKGVLPLLQETLVLLWSRFLRRRLLTLADYEALGSDGLSGLQVALSRHADAALAALTGEGQREIARRIFLRLIEFGEQRRNTRRQQPLEALRAEGDPLPAFQQVLEHLIQHRLLTSGSDDDSPMALVDLAHEKMIEAWPRLNEWLEAYQAMEVMRRSLALAATAWDENRRNPDYLFTGSRLQKAEAWVAQWGQELGATEQAFLAASRTWARRQHQRQHQRRVMGVAAISVVALGLLVVLTNVGHKEWVRRTIGTALVAVAGGPATIGTDDPQASELEQPQRRVTLLPFQIEQFEVSNHQYRACVESGPCSVPINATLYEDEGLADYPVVEVTARQAHVYCTWLGRRLPTTVEWERAVRGTAGRLWPWGNDLMPDEDYEFPFDLMPVDSEPETATPPPESVYHLVDNVMEWVVQVPLDCDGAACHQAWDGQADSIALIGGAYDWGIDRVSQVTGYSPDSPDQSRGFRCVAENPP